MRRVQILLLLLANAASLRIATMPKTTQQPSQRVAGAAAAAARVVQHNFNPAATPAAAATASSSVFVALLVAKWDLPAQDPLPPLVGKEAKTQKYWNPEWRAGGGEPAPIVPNIAPKIAEACFRECYAPDRMMAWSRNRQVSAPARSARPPAARACPLRATARCATTA